MANEIRRRSNFKSGTIDDNPLTNSATTLNSTELAGLDAIGSTEYAVLVLDPEGAGNGPEVVYVTAHTGSATSATIVRGREGTTGVQHTSVRTWIHVATAADYPTIGDDNDHPSGTGLPYEGQAYVDTTNDQLEHYNGTAWVRTGHYGATGRTGGTWTRTADQSIPTAGSLTDISWDAETFDSDGFLTPSSATVTVPAGLGGLYSISTRITHTWANNGGLNQLQIACSTAGNYNTYHDGSYSSVLGMSNSIIVPLAAAETVTVKYLQGTGGAQNVKARLDVYRLGI
jgi:hypothetical protein